MSTFLEARVGALEENQDMRVNDAFHPAPSLAGPTSKCPAYASPEPGGQGTVHPVNRALIRSLVQSPLSCLPGV